MFFLDSLDIELSWNVGIIDTGVVFHELEALQGNKGNVDPVGRPWVVRKGEFIWAVSGWICLDEFDHAVIGVGHCRRGW